MKDIFNFLFYNPFGIVTFIIICFAILILLSGLFYKQFFKRFYDIVISLIAIVVLSPVFLVLIVLGAIKMKGNPFFTQLRPGKINKKTGEERIFRLIKFRSMTCERDENGELLPDDKRLTKYGRLLRSTSLDEIPELFNILIGDMSIVGPRPLLVRDMVFMTDEQRKRHCVLPGLTGLAQVNGRNVITWEDKLNYDIVYVNKISFWKDLKIFFQTFLTVLRHDDVVREGTASDIDFGDWLLKNGKVNKLTYDEKQIEAKKILGV